ncbi:His/Gly/Thr/Pro-type tRNA ligase C-terminal domain-containing protein, partial [Salmonella enterica subsp. enterica serovar Typhimurium]|nr:His/Gly/Thr/Pro-type tRNA ligase C-terminal domain-containing protein [Salmonella enterica subsp. enterica serovar Typhimurium]
ELAENIMKELKFDFMVAYDEKDTVGKRYRRHDAIGTPFCITVDHQSLEDQTVTIRHRDSMKQDRVAISALHGILMEKTSMQSLLKTL